jgi:protein-disulfide isomerase
MRMFTLLILVLLMPFTTQAQDITQPDPPKSLKKMVESGSQIFYLGEFEGMNGWALIRQGKPEFFYENKDRTAMIMGLMFNGDGEMITMGQLTSLNRRVGDDMYAVTGGSLNQHKQAQIAQPAVTDTPVSTAPVVRELTQAQRMYTDLIASNWITINETGKHDVFAFIDPDCPHCKQMIREMDTAFSNDQIKLRVIPIGISDVGQRKAAVLLASANPEERLLKYAHGDNDALSAPQNINTKAVEKNKQTLLKWGFDATPIVVYRTLKGEIRVVRGRPYDLNNLIDDIEKN